ncbi:unnamed protein product [Cyprideis torosa]|uniref:Uncharacterized protein n=1 Tax=Cyprideis torosa TaxID=163714 RepID=A0A7R8W7A6_9CRUS|nr:unnamed protein product [Cyprideis torosa]CAG0887366.1 unnamed protein product [Cyprideis torosa]
MPKDKMKPGSPPSSPEEFPLRGPEDQPIKPVISTGDDIIQLKPKLSLLNGITVIVGSIIGSGIFISPTGVLNGTGSYNLALIVWAGCGVFSTIGAYCYAELGCMIRKSGADYAYIYEAFGPFLAFVRLWIECMIVRPCSQAVVALTFAVYILKPFFDTCDSPDEARRLLAVVCICNGNGVIKYFLAVARSNFSPFDVTAVVIRPCVGNRIVSTQSTDSPPVATLFRFASQFQIHPESAAVFMLREAMSGAGTLTVINCWDVKWATKVQDIFTFAKLFALALIIGAGLYELFTGHTENFTFENSETKITKIALSCYSGLFAYSGWNYLNFIIEELKDPVKNLPKAIAISCILVTLVYCLTNVAFFAVLSKADMKLSPAVAVTFAERVFGYFAWTIPIFVAMSTFGAVNGVLLTSSRLFYAGAMEGQMPEVLTNIQIHRMTPVPAILFQTMLSILYLTNSNISALINYVGVATWLSIGAAVCVIPWLRWKKPDLPRPIKVHLFWPIFYVLLTLLLVIISAVEAPVETGIGLAVIASACPVYALCIGWKNKPHAIDRFMRVITITIQKVLIVVPPDTRNE